MPSLVCPCGFWHKWIEVPYEFRRWVIRDGDLDAYGEAEVTREKLGAAEEGSPDWNRLIEADVQFSRLRDALFECPECGRLIWIKDQEASKAVYKIYRPEQEYEA